MSDSAQPIGTIGVIRRFPVKGMAGEELPEVFVTFAGLLGDRVYAFLDPQNKSDFPWITPRIFPEMLLMKPRFIAPPSADETRPAAEKYRLEISTPEKVFCDISAPEFRSYLQNKIGREIEFRFSERSMHDTLPVSVFGLPTFDALSKETGRNLDQRRFRPNFVVDWAEKIPFLEDTFVGHTIRIGEKLALRLVKKDMRCKVITLDPDTAEAAPEVLEVVAKKHGSCSGVYGTVLREGIVRRGDPVFVD
ncbi:MAG TPA: MOSC domain-containing protein [Candidatus Acidoferrales bacterium]|nr:MOSC domain-containing protein [Candidatus Acidoferrales bacterium]